MPVKNTGSAGKNRVILEILETFQYPITLTCLHLFQRFLIGKSGTCRPSLAPSGKKATRPSQVIRSIFDTDYESEVGFLNLCENDPVFGTFLERNV